METDLLAGCNEERLLAEVAEIVEQAASKNLELQFLGVAPLFNEVRRYRGPGYDWLICPAALDPMLRRGSLGVPRGKLRAMRKVSKEVAIPAIYVAHEMPAEPSRSAITSLDTGRVVLSPDEALDLIPPAPSDARTIAIASGASKAAETMIGILKKAARMTATAATAVGASALSIFAGTDPIILGAITLGGETTAGTPAAWVVIARWDW